MHGMMLETMTRLGESPTSIVSSTIMLPSSLTRAVTGKRFPEPRCDSWLASIRQESTSHRARRLRVCRSRGWQAARPILLKLVSRWKYRDKAISVEQKTEIVVQGSHELDPGDEPCTVVLMECIRAAFAKVAWDSISAHEVDIGTLLLPWKRVPDDPTIFVFCLGDSSAPANRRSRSGRSRRGCTAHELPTSHGWARCTNACYRKGWSLSGTAGACVDISNRAEEVLVLQVDMPILSPRRDVTDRLVCQTKDRFELADMGEASYVVCLAFA